MRYYRVVQMLLGLCLSLACDVRSSRADLIILPILPPLQLDHPVTWALMAAIFGVTAIIEFLVIYWILGRPKKARTTLFLVAFFLNMFTNPSAQIGVLILGYLFAIELLVIAIEFGVLMWVFSQMHHSGKLDHPVTALRTAVIAVIANVASFILGELALTALSILRLPRSLLPWA
ncbi:MAG: hypothetical protein AB1473_01670 [Thermodesulfobacteriota bacterium]